MKDVELAEPEHVEISRREWINNISSIVIAVIIMIAYTYGVFSIPKDLSKVEFKRCATSVKYFPVLPNTGSLPRYFYFDILQHIETPTFVKVKLTAERRSVTSDMKWPVSITQGIEYNGKTDKIYKFSSNFVGKTGQHESDSVDVYYRLEKKDKATIMLNFTTEASIFLGFHATLFYISSDTRPLQELRKHLLNIAFAGLVILVIQYTKLSKSFSSSTAFILGISTFLFANPLISKDVMSPSLAFLYQFSYAFFITMLRVGVPVVALAEFPYFEMLPKICIWFVVVSGIITFVAVYPLFTYNHWPFFFATGMIELPTSMFFHFAYPIILFLCITGVNVIIIGFFVNHGISKLKFLTTFVIYTISSYVTLTTTFDFHLIPKLFDLMPHQAMFYDAFVQTITAIMISLIFTNLQLEIYA